MKNILKFYIIAFCISLIWEVLHAPLYSHHESYASHMPMLLWASCADALIISVVYFIVTKLNIKSQYKLPLLCCSLLIIGFFLEKYSIMTGRWEYTTQMITLIGVGISPLIQLPVTALLATKLFIRYQK